MEMIRAPSLASPRTRRSTLYPGAAERCTVGFSAHAEVHRLPRAAWSLERGLLRARGGPPVRQHSDGRTVLASPRTRRSTFFKLRLHLLNLGFSAHAEVHPQTGSGAALRYRLLRARGGPPTDSNAISFSFSASPRTRRSTASHQPHLPRAVGFSAHAEVHPPKAHSGLRLPRLLRARGGPPFPSIKKTQQVSASPRTRRSTPAERSLCPGSCGFSAHAEVHPSSKCE